MTGKEANERLVAVEERSKSNTRRIEDLETSQGVLQELVASVKEIAIKQNFTNDSVSKINKKFEGIEDRISNVENQPGKKLEKLAEKIVYTILVALAGFFLAQLGLK